MLLGGDRNDVLSGGAGKDLLNGGRGNDTFLISDNTDKIVEAANGGNDLIRSSISFNLGTVKNVENLSLTGKAHLSAVGNNLDNQIEGNGGDNLLVAGRGKDRLTGGSGNDTYVIDAADLVFESANGGNDLVKSGDRIDLSRFVHLENAMLTGSANVDVTGNDKKNVLTGNDGKNDIAGAGGNDILTGGAGADHFVFSRGDGRDTISDFVAGGTSQDLIDLSEFGSNLRFSNLAIKQVGQNTEINFGKGDALVLKDVDAHEIGKADFIF